MRVETASPPATLLKVDGLIAGYGSRPILQGLDCEVRSGELVSLFGPNGTGKSTFFRCILGRLRHGGTVLLGDAKVEALSATDRARRVTYVPQEHGGVFPLSVLDVVLLGRTPHLVRHRGPSQTDVDVALQALTEVGIDGLANRLFTQLSGGQRQLVLIARALAQDAPLLLLDEPTASLDYGNQAVLWQIVSRVAASGRGVLICTHDPAPVRKHCTRALVLGREGRLLADGPPREAVSDEMVARLYPDAVRT